MEDKDELIAFLRRVGEMADDDINLAEASLALGALQRGNVRLTPYRDHLEQLSSDLAAAAGSDPSSVRTVMARADILAGVLSSDYGYVGDQLTYDNIANANLLDVIDRRKGLPVAIAILYVSAARSVGWSADGLSFPGHFVIRLDGDDGSVVLDPFNGGALLETHDLQRLLQQMGGAAAQLNPDMIERLPNRDILIRLQNNIRTRLVDAQLVEKAIEVAERMVLIAPQKPLLWFELGQLCAQAGRLRASEKAFQHCLAANPSSELAYEIKKALGQTRRQLN